jgi:YVTN family beta-propeller protein
MAFRSHPLPVRAVLVMLAAVITACQSASVAGSAQASVVAPASRSLTGIALVANQQSADVSIIDLGTGAATRVPVGPGPHEAAISRDGRWGVATVYGTQPPGNKLAILDLGAKSVVRTIDLGQYTRPHGVMFHPTIPTQVLVTSEASRNVVVVDITNGTIVAAIPTEQQGSHMLGVTADASRVFTANVGSGTATELDLAGRKMIRHFPIAPQSEGIAVTPDGAEIWVGSNAQGTVTVIDTKSGSVVTTLTGFSVPYRLGSSPDGKMIVVCDPQAGRIAIIDRATRKVTGEIAGLASPRGVMVAEDNRTALVTLGEDSAVAIVDLIDRSVVRKIGVGPSPDGVAVRLGR